jgi:8-oxo-dGTP diphosphatase
MNSGKHITIAQHAYEKRDRFSIAVSVDCVIFGYEDNDLKVLLIKSDLEEYEQQWSLLGDLVKVDENLDDASYRVLKWRTGLDDVYLEQVITLGDVNRHPAGRVITVVYYSLVNIQDHQLRLKDNEVHWHSVYDIKTLAFDHKHILDVCVQKLRERIWESPIVMRLLPEKFSLRELQNVYEAILNTRLDRRNFRKKISLMKWLEDVEEYEQDVPHRPGKLYRLSSRFMNLV